MVIPVFLVLFFGIYEFSRYYYTRAQIRGAVAEATRFASTGSQLEDPDTGTPLSRALSVESMILADVGTFGVDGDDITLSPSEGGPGARCDLRARGPRPPIELPRVLEPGGSRYP